MAGRRTMKTKLTLVGEGSEEDMLIGNIASVGEQVTEAGEIETTTLDSPNSFREFEQGLKDAGSVDLEINNVYDGTTETLDSIFDASEKRDWKIEWPDSSGDTAATLDFTAFIMSLGHGEATTDGVAKTNTTLRISGKPTYSESSS